MDAVRPSPEIEAIVRRFLLAYSRRDADTVTNLLSASPALAYIGSSENEFWRGETLRKGFSGYTEDVPDFVPTEDLIQGFECGTAGWAFWIGNTRRADTGQSAHFRITCVLVLERGIWRIVHVHNSNPVSNLVSLGYESRSFDDLLSAARADPAPVTGMTSVMFTDIADSTSLAQTLGDARWTSTVAAHLADLRGKVENRGGVLVKSLGDGTLSAFTSARAALEAAQQIQAQNDAARQEPRLRLRIGLHTGDVIQAEGDYFGTVVNKAARVAASAAPGEIRVSDATRVMVAGAHDLRFTDSASIPLKGLDGEHLIHRLEWHA